MVRQTVGNAKDFSVALGMDVVANVVGAVGLGNDHIHGLVGVVGGTDQYAGLERNVEERSVGATGGAGGAQLVEFEILGCRVFWRRFLFEGGDGLDDGAVLRFRRLAGAGFVALLRQLCGAARFVAEVSGFSRPDEAGNGGRRFLGLFGFPFLG